MRNGRHARAGIVMLLAVGVAAACSSGGNAPAAPVRAWDCHELTAGESCSCNAYDPSRSGVFSGSNPIPRCQSYSCCFITGTGYKAVCECLQSNACDAEVGSRANAKAVAQCPPPDEQPPVHCGKEGENCRAAYLEQNGLEGCCDGLYCGQSSDGVPVCKTGTPEELAGAKLCSQTTRLSLTDTIQSTMGPVDGGIIRLKSLVTGPGGCVVSMEIEFSSCGLVLGPARDASGAFTVAVSQCTLARFGNSVLGTAAFSGVACPASTDGRECIGGTIEFVLTSTYGFDQVPYLDGAPFHVEGGGCVEPQIAATCDG